MPPVLSLSSLTLIASSTVTTSAGLPRSIRRETWRKMRRWSSREKSPSVTTSPILSKAPLSIKRPPRTDCSASIECGGTLRFSSCESEAACGRGWAMKALENLWRRLYRVNAQTKRAARRGPSINGLRLLLRSFPQHRDFDVNEDVGVQRDRDRMVSDGFQRPLRQADHRALDLEPLRFQRLDDIEIGDRAEQVSVDACLLRDLDHKALQLGSLFLRRRKSLGLGGLELRAFFLEFGEAFGRCPLRLALGQKIVAGVSVLHLDHVAQAAEVDDFFQKNHLHGGSFSAGRCTASARDSARA